jgi:aminopeptidase
MSDSRILKLADVLISHSTKLEPGERVLIETFDVPEAMITGLIDRTIQAGGIPFVETKNTRILRKLYQNASDEMMERWASWELKRMEQMDAYIGIRGSLNALEHSDVPQDRMAHYQKHLWRGVHTHRVNNTKWTVMRYPTPAFAQSAGMSTEAFEEFYFNVCTLDYAKMDRAQIPLRDRMNAANRVRITGKDTNLEFSIAGLNAIVCSGEHNIPDGECFTAPVKDSVNGVISYNTPAVYQGSRFENIRLEFKDGKVVNATSSDTKRLNEILDSDEGARFVGEFAIGFNPYITTPMMDTLFDEKIAGSLHFTPGQAYEGPADNGNRSTVHWDIVLIQTPEYGGGEIYFDDELIRKDGLFVPADLQGLNPDQLKS